MLWVRWLLWKTGFIWIRYWQGVYHRDVFSRQVGLVYDNNDIQLAIIQDKTLQEYLHHLTENWSLDISRLLLKDEKIYMPLANNLHTHILQYYHDHILTEHFGQNKTLELIYYGYTWPSIYTYVKSFYNSFVTCMRSKSQYYKPYKTLKQLSISKQLWNSISIDFIEKLPIFSGCDTILVIIDWLYK